MKIGVLLSLIILAVGTLADAGAAPEKPGMTVVKQERYKGYLPSGALPDSLVLLPPPPSGESLLFAVDQEANRAGFALRGSDRWKLAAQDADLSFPAAAEIFSCALQTRITAKETPRLYKLLQRTLADSSAAVSAAKDHYKRKRPFLLNGEPVCTPDYEKRLRRSGSYPSGHTTVGWVWAMILSELVPERANQLMLRGRNYGQSRVLCNVHWQSDVNEGRTVAAALVARLHADPAFRADLEAARAELAAVIAAGVPPVRDCRAEAEALALTPLR